MQSLNLFAQSEGMKLQANQGKVTIQAQNDEMQINALKDATITSSAGKVTIAAKDEILLTSGGAYIKIANGKVELGMPNIARIRCAGLSVTGTKSINMQYPFIPKAGKYNLQFHFTDDNNIPYANTKFTITLPNYQIFEGVTDNEGFTPIFYSETKGKADIELQLDQDRL